MTGGSEIDCDDQPPNVQEQISMPFETNDVRFVWIDGFNGEAGAYGMVVATQ